MTVFTTTVQEWHGDVKFASPIFVNDPETAHAEDNRMLQPVQYKVQRYAELDGGIQVSVMIEGWYLNKRGMRDRRFNTFAVRHFDSNLRGEMPSSVPGLVTDLLDYLMATSGLVVR